MKLILCIAARNDEILNISETLKSMGHEVLLFYTDGYRAQCSYWEKKLDKLGWSGKRKRFEKQWVAELSAKLVAWMPDKCIFIDAPNDLASVQDLQRIYETSKDLKVDVICWFVDPVSDRPDIIEYCQYFDQIYVYERRDVEILCDLGIEAHYLPVGYQHVYGSIQNTDEKVWDICFVGSPYKNRLQILERVAREAKYVGWQMIVMGPFWPQYHLWKKYIFKTKYPYLYPCICNRQVKSAEVAELYTRTSICLNIHVPGVGGVNPRTFEIMATKAFEIMDERADYDRLVPQKDVVVFKDADELIEKIKYYLQHIDERKRIAGNGYVCAREKYSIDVQLGKILK